MHPASCAAAHTSRQAIASVWCAVRLRAERSGGVHLLCAGATRCSSAPHSIKCGTRRSACIKRAAQLPTRPDKQSQASGKCVRVSVACGALGRGAPALCCCNALQQRAALNKVWD